MGDVRPDRMKVTMNLEGGCEARWQVRVDLAPIAGAVDMCGVTLGLVDADGEALGPAVVLPLGPSLQEPTSVSALVRGPNRLHGHVLLRLTAYLADCADTLVFDHRVSACRGFRAFLAGVSPMTAASPPPGRALTGAEQSRFFTCFPWLAPAREQGDDAAFDAFKEDFQDIFEFDGEGATEEILSMLRG